MAELPSALAQYVVATPEIEHHLLHAVRPDFADDGEFARFASVQDLSRQPLRAASQIRRAVREISPGVVHAHSSLAGVMVRSSLRNRKPVRIVYTPHGFASERRDVSSPARWAFAAAEWALAWNTDAVAACSRREEMIAGRRRTASVVFVPNVADPDLAALRSTPTRGRVVGLGRLAAQKDPDFFLATVEALRDEGESIDPVWIGGGSPHLAAALVEGGIRVTGWLPRRAALERLAAAAVYLHTSAWDAGPMALLEATAIGVPSVAHAEWSPCLGFLSQPAVSRRLRWPLFRGNSSATPRGLSSNLKVWRETLRPPLA